mgnify:CR=1 FL=1
MFYGATALLALKNLSAAKHSGVLALFNREFVKTKLMSIKSSKSLTKAFDLRIEGDYKDFTSFKRC